MPPARSEVQPSLAAPQPKASFVAAASLRRPTDAQDKKTDNAPVGSIAAIETRLGF